MTRTEFNVQTGEVQTITLTPQEEADALAKQAAWAAAHTLDARAIRAIDALDKLQFEHLFDLENRTRTLEGRAQVTKPQYRDALIVRWKAIYQ